MVVDDDRNLVERGDRVLLIVEDDVTFARIMVDVARSHGTKASSGFTGRNCDFAGSEFQPSAITLDVRLPDNERLDSAGSS